MANGKRIGGSFAPPLTDELLSEYKGILDRSEPSAIRDAQRPLLKCCDHWWALPDPAGAVTRPHPIGHVVAPTGAIVVPRIVSLQADHQAELWEDIPWTNELDGDKALFAPVEAGQAFRNGQKMQEWRIRVYQAIVAKNFPKPGLYEQLCEAMKSAGVWLGLLPDGARTKYEADQKKVFDTIAEITRALTLKSFEPIPLPSLEPTAHRDALHHLLWHAVELDFDREPLTNDKLI